MLGILISFNVQFGIMVEVLQQHALNEITVSHFVLQRFYKVIESNLTADRIN